MAALFRPWSNTAFRLTLVLSVSAILGAVAAPMIWVRMPSWRGQFDPIDQPVEFDHRHHVQDDGIDCTYCHSSAMSAASAGIPSTELCMGCHNQIWNQSPMLEPVRRSYFSGEPIPWNRVHDVPDFVYFNHAIHTNKGFGCVTCHGRVDWMGRVYQVADLTMGWCLDCHRHPEAQIRPLDKITDMTWVSADQATLGPQLVHQYRIRNLTNCSACHR
ncbi:MAG TPA: cytochrome c3 family protein [Polyangium sp.]|nr:cytochrome c3 family protein [Polyangium sp.]